MVRVRVTLDLGDEYYDPARNLIFSYDGETIKRTPDQAEIQWIVSKCGYKVNSQNVPKICGVDDQTNTKIIQNRKGHPA